jgi:hypothetical protein
VDENFYSGTAYSASSNLELELELDEEGNIFMGGSEINEYDFFPMSYLFKLFGK